MKAACCQDNQLVIAERLHDVLVFDTYGWQDNDDRYACLIQTA